MNAWLGLSKWQLEGQRDEQQVKELVETAKATITENYQSTIRVSTLQNLPKMFLH